jgi:hypothetical protein
MLYEHYLDLADLTAARVAEVSDLPEPARGRVQELLQLFDLLHREALMRLTERLREEGAGAALENACADPVVKTLLGLYGLAQLDLAPDAADAHVAFFPADRLTVHRTRSGP